MFILGNIKWNLGSTYDVFVLTSNNQFSLHYKYFSKIGSYIVQKGQDFSQMAK